MTARMAHPRSSILAFCLTLGLSPMAWADNGNGNGHGHDGNPSGPRIVKVAAAQTQPIILNNAANLADIVAKVDTAAAAGAQLVVFPELALTGYKFKTIQEERPFAEPVPGPATDTVTAHAVAGNIYVAFGMLESDGDEIYNSSVLVGPEGYVGKYRKAHGGYKSESKLFSRGDLGFPVFETSIGRIGLGICYDANFPEATRVAAEKGAEILVQPQNDGNFFWPELVLARTTESNIYAVVANRIGTERFAVFGGNSLVAGPNWTTIVRGTDTANTIYYANIDLNALNHSWKDGLRPNLYRPLAEPLTPQVMAIELNPESQAYGIPETVVARFVTATVHEHRPYVAEMMSGGAPVVTVSGHVGPQGGTVDMELPAGLPIGAYTLRVTVDDDPTLRVEAPFVVQDLPRPRAAGTRPTDLPATVSGAFNVGLDRQVNPATGVPVVVTGGPSTLTFTGSVNTTIVDNRFAANYAGLLAGTTYTATIPANRFFSTASGAGNSPITFQFTTAPAPFNVKAALVQMNPVQGAVSANLSSMHASLDTAANAANKLIVFPELSLTGSGFADRAAAGLSAETIPGASVDSMTAHAQARNVYAAFGMLERAWTLDGEERLYNTFVLVGPEGLVGTYRKAHLSAADALYADLGDGPLQAYTTVGIGKVGLALTDGLNYPEIARVAFVQGATTIIMGANLSNVATPNWFEVMRTRATESKNHVLVANRVGNDGVMSYDGRSIITTNNRTVLVQAAANVAVIVSATLNIDTVLDKRGLGNVDQNTGKVRTIHYLLDRRPDLYHAMIHRHTPDDDHPHGPGHDKN